MNISQFLEIKSIFQENVVENLGCIIEVGSFDNKIKVYYPLDILIICFWINTRLERKMNYFSFHDR